MRVLMTNCALRGRSGTEIVIIDLASGLRQRGHEVAVFAPLLGPSAEILRRRDIPVTDRLEEIPWTPDVVHGHHNHVLTAALAFFQESPGLFVCHSSAFWFDGPPRLPRVRKLCAVDEACRDRLLAEAGCSRDEIVLLTNAVDTGMFALRDPLPTKPARALLLAKNTAHVAAVREAAQGSGLALDEVGSAFGREVDDLHLQLGKYDLAFATARMALEAMAVGCAVIVVDGRGLAGLATAATVDDWRVRNFGVSLLTRSPTVEAISAEIARYDAVDASAVSTRIREVASLSGYVDRVEAMHREVAAAPRRVDPPDDLRASGLFMAQWLRRLGEGMIPENFDTLLAANKFAAEHRAMVDENAALRNDKVLLRREIDDSAARACVTELELVRLRRENELSPLGALRYQVAAWRGRLFGPK
ncbi:MAG: glycosyltransferase family 4 protein [bacterium]|nr:glycosyltransferase family 4 protein [bacterium]